MKRGAVLLALAALVLVAAGCGTKVVVRTHVVRPCATERAMSDCVAAITNEFQKMFRTHASVRTGCDRRKDGNFDCLVAIGGPLGTTCARLTIVRVGVGIPFATTQEEVPASVCDSRWSS